MFIMKNTLKVVLLLVGGLLICYGVYTFVRPEASLDSGPLQVEGSEEKTQSLAMIGLGILTLLGGMAFRKR